MSYYPKSKFIILHRDPRDNAYTKWRMFEKLKQAHEMDYYRIAYYWNHTYSSLLQAKEKSDPNRFLEVKYEDLVSNPIPELKKISAFLNIHYDPAMLQYDIQLEHEINALERTDKETHQQYFMQLHEALLKKPSTAKIGYWKTGLLDKEANLIWKICGPLAQKIGYVQDPGYVNTKLRLSNIWCYLSIRIDLIKTRSYYLAPFGLKKLIKKIKRSIF